MNFNSTKMTLLLVNIVSKTHCIVISSKVLFIILQSPQFISVEIYYQVRYPYLNIMSSHEVCSSDFVEFRLSCASHYAILLKKNTLNRNFFHKEIQNYLKGGSSEKVRKYFND